MGALDRFKAKENKILEFADSLDTELADVETSAEQAALLMCDVYAKDLRPGMITHATVFKVGEDSSELHTPAQASVFVSTAKENKFMEALGMSGLAVGDEINVLVETVNSGVCYGSIEKAALHSTKQSFKDSLLKEDSAYEGVVKSFNDGGYIVTVGGLDCFMPNSHAGANRISDPSVMVGRVVKVMVEGHIESSDMYVVSVRKYIKRILPGEISKIDLMQQKTGRVTGIVSYGVFVEWDEIFTGLIYESEAADGWQAYQIGQEVNFHVKEVRGDDRIVLTQKGASEEMSALITFKAEFEGSIVDGYVSQITEDKDKKVTGAVVEVQGVTGFLPAHQMRNMRQFKETDLIEVYVGSVDVASRRVSLRSPRNVR
jgi:ribosomal protein S1